MRQVAGCLVLSAALMSVALANGPGGRMNSGSMNNSGMNSRSERSTPSDDASSQDLSASYDLKAVTERFTKTPNGGVLHVVAIESSDAKQIGLIRSVLKQRADDFAGQYKRSRNQPMGPTKPGLATLLAASAGDLEITYLEIRGGGDVRFSSAVPELVSAVHQWFDAQ
jgi:hypothetical protein